MAHGELNVRGQETDRSTEVGSRLRLDSAVHSAVIAAGRLYPNTPDYSITVCSFGCASVFALLFVYSFVQLACIQSLISSFAHPLIH